MTPLNMTKLSVKAPSTCVIIVSFNFERWIHKCLSSVMTSKLSSTILVIDNGSNDDTCEIIKKEYPDVILFETHENLGFGRANNIGMKYAKEAGFEYLFLLNQDAWIESDTLDKLIAAAKNNSEYGILSPVHLNGKGDATDFGFSEYTQLQNREEALQLSYEVTEYPFINAAMWLIPVRVIDKVGVFAPIFSHYGEDRNLVHRLLKKGYKLGLVKSAFGYHDRASRIVNHEQKFYSEYVYFLTEAVNPLYSYPQSIVYSFFASLKKAIMCMLQKKQKESREYFKIALRLIKLQPFILRTRKDFT